MTQAPARITVDPDPPVQGQPLTVSYDFAGSGITETTLTLDWDPPGGTPTSIHLTVDPPSTTFTVPDNADGLIIRDDSGKSAMWGGTVSSS